MSLGACQITSETTDNNRCSVSQTSAQWGSAVASYTEWAMCRSWLDVANVLTFDWGDFPNTGRVSVVGLE